VWPERCRRRRVSGCDAYELVGGESCVSLCVLVLCAWAVVALAVDFDDQAVVGPVEVDLDAFDLGVYEWGVDVEQLQLVKEVVFVLAAGAGGAGGV
jgi:hypothetical protein